MGRDGAIVLALVLLSASWALAHLVLLAGDLLAARHDPFDVAIQRDDHRRPFEAGDRARDDRADAILVFFVN